MTCRGEGAAGWWTRWVNHSLARPLVRLAVRKDVSPGLISVVKALVGVLASGGATFLLVVNPLAAAAVGFFGWQLAHTLDRVDGQVARETGKSSPTGGVLDLLCDFLVRVSIMVCGITAAFGATGVGLHGPVAVLLTGGWLISPYYRGIFAAFSGGAFEERTSFLGLCARLFRDYGLHIALLAGALVLGPRTVFAVLGVVAALNYAFLAEGIVEMGDSAE